VTHTLKKTLGFWDSVAIVIGSVVGTGIFRTPSEVCQYVNDPAWVLVAWVLGGVIAFLGTLCYCELAASFPETGGTYVYLKYAFGPWAGWLFGWSELALMRTASIASVAYAFGEYFGNLLPGIPGGEKGIAISAIWLLTLINIAGLHYGKWLQNVVSGAKLLALAALVVLGLALGQGSLNHFESVFPSLPESGFLSKLGLALVPILWTYGGWHESTFVAGEFKRPDTDLPFSLLTAAGLVIFFYLVVNGVYLYLFPATEIAARKLIAGDVIQSIFGPVGEKIITVTIVTCIFGVLNTVILAGGRIPYAVAQDHPVLSWLGGSHDRFQTPHRSLFVNAAWGSVLVLWGNFGQLLFLSAAAVWLFFAAAGAAVLLARFRFRERLRPFSAWGYPWTAILFTAAAFWIFVNTAIYSPRETGLGFAIIAVGLPLYWISCRLEAGGENAR
jgi:APA family basic amino acid/polyamine antiporter